MTWVTILDVWHVATSDALGVPISDVGNNDTSADDIEEDLSVYYDLEETPSVTFNYTISFVTSGCYFWDVIEETWSTMGCQVRALINGC